MKTPLSLFLLLCGFVFLPLLHGAQVTDVAQPGPADSMYVASDRLSDDIPADDFSPRMFFFVLLGLLLMVVGAIIALCFIVAGLALLLLLVFWGVTTASVLVGVYRKSFKKGFKTFWGPSSFFLGAFSGAALSLPIHYLFNVHYSKSLPVLWGSLAGGIGGLVFGLLAFSLLRRLFSAVLSRLMRKPAPAEEFRS